MSDLGEIKRRLTAQAQRVAAHLLPAGVRDRHEWRAGSVHGDAGKSLGVRLDGPKAGVWQDFATDEGGDLIDLWRATRRVNLPSALDEICDWLGIKRERTRDRRYRPPPPPPLPPPPGTAGTPPLSTSGRRALETARPIDDVAGLQRLARF